MSRSRKHGVFAVSGDVVVISSKQKELRKDDKEIQKALETIFHQMRIAGNRQRTIESYAYIFQQFVGMCHIEYVEDINIDKLYHYLDVLEVTPATKLIRLKSIKAVLSKFYNNGWIKDRFWSNIVLPQADVRGTAYIRGGWHGKEGFQIKYPDESWAYGNLDLVTESDLTKMHEAIYLPTDEEIDQMVNDELGIE